MKRNKQGRREGPVARGTAAFTSRGPTSLASEEGVVGVRLGGKGGFLESFIHDKGGRTPGLPPASWRARHYSCP